MAPHIVPNPRDTTRALRRRRAWSLLLLLAAGVITAVVILSASTVFDGLGLLGLLAAGGSVVVWPHRLDRRA